MGVLTKLWKVEETDIRDTWGNWHIEKGLRRRRLKACQDLTNLLDLLNIEGKAKS